MSWMRRSFAFVSWTWTERMILCMGCDLFNYYSVILSSSQRKLSVSISNAPEPEITFPDTPEAEALWTSLGLWAGSEDDGWSLNKFECLGVKLRLPHR
jgi:hypothetical protein